MPGLVGYVGIDVAEDDGAFLNGMARALEPEDVFHLDAYQDRDTGLGRVSLRIINPEPQPTWNEDRTICVLMEGELYGYEEIKQGLIARGHQFKLNNDPEFVVHLYEEFGDDFAVKLNGSFAIAIWDKIQRRLVVATDRIGQFPLYYADRGNYLLFASGLRGLLTDPKLPRKIDRLGIAQFLTFEHLLNDRTFLEDVQRLPPASLLSYQNKQLSVRPYWQMRHPSAYTLRAEGDWIDDLTFHLRQAVNRQANAKSPTGVLLSGGIDSRIILAFMSDSPAKGSMSTLTWGIPGCHDALYAKEMSKKVGVPNHFFLLRPDWLIDKAEMVTRITDGMGNIVNQHAVSVLPGASIAPVVYKGFMGDGMMGYSLKQQHWADYNEETRIKAHLQVHREQGALIFDLPTHSQLFTGAFLEQIGDSVMESYAAAMDVSGARLMADQRNVFGLVQRVPRMALNGVEVVRNRMFVRLPFCDNDLIEFSLSVPPGLRYRRHLTKNSLIKTYPKLAQVPNTETGYPLMECTRDVMMRFEDILRWHLHTRGFTRVSYPSKRPYQNYNEWFRTVLKDWMIETLSNEQFYDLGCFKREYIEGLVQEQLAGAKHAGRLGALLSIALWQRMYL